MSETGAQYLARRQAQFDWDYHGQVRDADGWEHNSYEIIISHVNVTERFAWRQGLGIAEDPDPTRVLAALVADTYYGYLSFEEFCAELGYDPDSRKAEATWRACQRVREQLENLFGEVPDVEER